MLKAKVSEFNRKDTHSADSRASLTEQAVSPYSEINIVLRMILVNELNNIISLTRGHNLYMAEKIDLIASNSCISNFARLTMSSSLINNYCIGLPGARFYGGCTFIDMIEREVHSLVRSVFGNMKHVVVQFLSGMQANIGAYNAILKPGDTVIAAGVHHGGHYSHTARGPLKFFAPRIVPMPFDDKCYNVDLNALEDHLKAEKPTLMILGWSEFLFPHPLAPIRALCDRYHVKIMYDMSHVVGLIAGRVFQPDAMRYADIVTSSTGKSLHAPDHGLVMYNDDAFHEGVLQAVMPLLTSNTHPHEVAGLGVALSEMQQFGHAYATQVVANSKALGKALEKEGVRVLYGDLGFTESHTLLVEYPKASAAVTMLDRAGILINACQLPWDKGDVATGLRLGTQVITRHGYTEKDMPEIARIISEVLLKNKDPDIVHFSLAQPMTKQFRKIAFSFDKDFPVQGDWHEKLFQSYKAENASAILRSNPAFANCHLSEIESIEKSFELIKIKKGDLLFDAQSESDSVYFIAHGAIEILDSQQKIVNVLSENQQLGELGVMTGHKRKYAARAQASSVMLKISATDFLDLLKRFSPIKAYFERYIISLDTKAN